MKTGIRLMSVMSLVLGLASTSNGQSDNGLVTPNKFHGYTLGAPLFDFSQKNLQASDNNLVRLFSSIKTTGMLQYTLKDQLTEGGDKIDIDFFFYNDSLSIIRVDYKDKQSSEELLEALKGRYGDNSKQDNSYMSGVIENLYWEKWPCCIINLTSVDETGHVYLTFVAKAAQVKIKNKELINREKRIN